MEAFTPRVEDDRLVRGAARFVDDVRPADCLFGAFVRSPHAFATINSIDVRAAASHPQVRAIMTATDMKAVMLVGAPS